MQLKLHKTARQELGIEHRRTRPRTPRTDGMVERFNGRVADVLRTHRFASREDPNATLLRHVHLYSQQLPQSALKSKTPVRAMKDGYQRKPESFNRRPRNQPGCDTWRRAWSPPAGACCRSTPWHAGAMHRRP